MTTEKKQTEKASVNGVQKNKLTTHSMKTGKLNFSHAVSEGDLRTMFVRGKKYYPLTHLYRILSPYFRPRAIFDAFLRYGLVALDSGNYDFISNYGLVGLNELKTSDKPVGIVRDGVSAIFMALTNSKETWLGIDNHSEYNLYSPEVVKILGGRKITLYPYAGERDHESEKTVANYLKTKGLSIEADGNLRRLENHFSYKFDIADMNFDMMDGNLDCMI